MKTKSFLFPAAVIGTLVAVVMFSLPTAEAQQNWFNKLDHDAGIRKSESSLRDDQMVYPYIDTHTHLDPTRMVNGQNIMPTVQLIVEQMQRLKIQKTFLLALPQGGAANRQGGDISKMLPAHRQFPDKIMLMGGPGVLGKQYFQKPADTITDQDRAQFRTGAEELASLAAIVGFGEFGITHLHLPQMGPDHPYESVAADHPLLLLLTDIAAEHGLPIDVHFDLVPHEMQLPPGLRDPSAEYPNPSPMPENLSAFERFISHNPNTKIVWAHVGGEPLETRTVEMCRKLFQAHPNLYMSFRLERGGSDPALALNQRGTLKPAWLALIKEFPDRFVLGSDTFYADGPKRRGGSTTGQSNFHLLLDQLPPDVAKKIAFENVYRIYRMPNG